jgi:hypothetical protein
MISYYIVSIATCFFLFIVFLVLSKTLNGIVNELIKIEYMLQKEYEYKKEIEDINRMIEDSTEEKEKTGD